MQSGANAPEQAPLPEVDDRYQELIRTQDRLRLLLEITNRVVSKLELPDLLREISANIRRVLDCNVVGVRLPDPETGGLMMRAVDSRSELPIDLQSAVLMRSAEAVFRKREAARLGSEEIAAAPEIAAAGTKSLCMLPLISHERVLGVLGLGSDQEHAYRNDDLSFLSQVANQIALAVENAFAYGEISQLKDRLARENIYLESEIRDELHFDEVVGTSKALQRVLNEVETVAPADSTVLIYGETGTGKELRAGGLRGMVSVRSAACIRDRSISRWAVGGLRAALRGSQRDRSGGRDSAWWIFGVGLERAWWWWPIRY